MRSSGTWRFSMVFYAWKHFFLCGSGEDKNSNGELKRRKLFFLWWPFLQLKFSKCNIDGKQRELRQRTVEVILNKDSTAELLKSLVLPYLMALNCISLKCTRSSLAQCHHGCLIYSFWEIVIYTQWFIKSLTRKLKFCENCVKGKLFDDFD